MPAERLLPLVERELKEAGLETRDSGVGLPTAPDGTPRQFKQTVLLLQSRARTLKDFAGAFRAFFTDEFAYDPEAVKKYWKDAALPGASRRTRRALGGNRTLRLGRNGKALCAAWRKKRA